MIVDRNCVIAAAVRQAAITAVGQECSSLNAAYKISRFCTKQQADGRAGI